MSLLRVLATRLKQGYRTAAFPPTVPVLSDRYRGAPRLGGAACPSGCADCLAACPTEAIRLVDNAPTIDLGCCLFCGDCASVCDAGAITFSADYQQAARTRADLVVGAAGLPRLEALAAEARRVFGRSLKLRQVSAGGCNACEADTNVLGTLAFDLGRFGIQFVAAPRHADGLLVTGPVTRNMELALRKTYEAVPSPRFVIAVGACALSGGPYAGHAEVLGGAEAVVPVDLFVPGCPPHPLTILDALLRWLGRIEAPARPASPITQP